MLQRENDASDIFAQKLASDSSTDSYKSRSGVLPPSFFSPLAPLIGFETTTTITTTSDEMDRTSCPFHGSDHCRAAKGCRSSVSLRFITGIRDVTELFSITRTVTRRNRRRCDEPATLKYRCTRRRPWIIPRWDQFCTGLESISGLLPVWWMIGGKGGREGRGRMADIFNVASKRKKRARKSRTRIDSKILNGGRGDFDSSRKGWNNIPRYY